MPRALTRLWVGYYAENELSFLADRELRMGIVVRVAGFHLARNVDHRHKGLIVDETFKDPQVTVHPKAGSAAVEATSPRLMRRTNARTTLVWNVCPLQSASSSLYLPPSQ